MWLPPAEIWRDRVEDRRIRGLLGDWLRKPTVLMSGSASNYLSAKIIQEVFGGVAFSAPANEYVGLWTATLDDTSTGSTGSEAAYGSYARTQVGTGNNQTDAWNAATGSTTSTVTNKNAVTMPTSSSGTSTITFGGVLDAATTGNMLVWFSTASTVINSGDTPKINASGMSHVLD
jgi:hypothetical protein